MGALPWLFQFLLYFAQYHLAFSSSSSSLSSFSTSPHPLCHHDQRSALLQFKHMFTIDSDASSFCDASYPKTTSWNESNATDCCNWDGVTCDGFTGHVIGLDLSCSQLYGTIHPNSSLFQLSHLQRLNLAFNNFNDSRVSYEIGSFASLTHLNLSDSWFSGSIPSQISHLSKLISLDLSYSDLRLEPLHFKILLKNLTRLQELVLPDVNISFALPYSVVNLTSLTALDLSWTGLRGNLPENIFHLPNLDRLILFNNDGLDVNLPKLNWHNGSSLRELDLSFTKLSEELPYSFGNLTSLNSLTLSAANLSEKLSDSIGHLKSLKSLYLYGPSLSGKIPNSIFNIKSLNHLIFSGCELRGSIPKSIGNLTQLLELDLSSNSFDGEVPFTLSNLKQLTSLDLSRNNLEGRIPDFLAELPMLQSLNLRGNNFIGGFPLDLSSNSFDGEVPSTLSNLKQLTSLDLSGNNLEGRIADFLAELPMLQRLNLGSNNFVGGFPVWVANMKSLVYLDISNNNLTGPLPFNLSGLQNLRTLYLYNNFLSGIIPPWLFTLPSLEYLALSSNLFAGQISEFKHNLPLLGISLSDNKLHGTIPQSIYTLVNLTYLLLSSNDLSGGMDLQKLKNLKYLDLSNTNLSLITTSGANNTFPNLREFYMSSCNIEVFPDFLRTSEKLEWLDLSNNRIRGQIPNWVGFIGKASLSYLNLSHNFLTDIKQLPWERLDTLDLHSNSLQGQLPIPPPSMRYFFISNNSLGGEIPSLICNASSLQILDLSHNQLSGAVPQCLGNFSSDLSVLDLRSNGFKGTLPFVFSKENNLQSLELNGNQFEGPLPRSLMNCTNLEVLNVGNNKINDTFPNWLGTLPELQVLVLRFNRFHGPINTSMTKFPFPKLRIVDLSYNGFTGYLPNLYFEHFQAMKNNTMPDKKYMGDKSDYYHDSLIITMKGFEIEWARILTIFMAIDFSSNNFSGEIPNVVGKLNSLKVLNFSHNCLTGHIPESLGDLTNLESLDISSNRLSGRIPSQLTSLTFLADLNLSWNHLDGPIPRGPQFNTFDNGSYVGNPGLCGFPLPKCEENQAKIQPPVLQQQEDDPYFDGYFWKIVVIGYGCGMTLGLFLGSLMFLIGRPKFFVRLAEKEVPKKVVRLRRMVTDAVGRRK